MAKTKELTFDDIATKLSHVFKKDLYILNNKYVLPGDESDDSLGSSIMCELTPSCIEVIQKTFDNKPFIFIPDIKSYKNDNNVIYKVEKTAKDEIESKLNKMVTLTEEIPCWETLKMSENDAESLFTYGRSHTLFLDGSHPKLIISAKIFPMMTIKNFNMLRYYVQDKASNDLYTFVSLFDTEYFQIENVIRYIALDE